MKVALLGANGFVGRNVSQEFKNRQIDFVPVSRRDGYDLRKREDNLRFIKESNCKVIVNCAAHVGGLQYFQDHAAEILHDNSQMILSLYEGVREIDPEILIIQPVANCAFPAKAEIYKEEELWDGPMHPSVKPYGITKRLLLSAAECYRSQYGIRSLSFLTPNMYGPHDTTDPDKAHALNALMLRFLNAEKENKGQIEFWGSGKVVREWLYVKDFARLIANIIEEANGGNLSDPVNIGQNWGISIKELVTLIAGKLDYRGEINWNLNMPDGTLKKVMDNAAFQKAFPAFTFTSLDDGITETLQFYKSQLNL